MRVYIVDDDQTLHPSIITALEEAQIKHRSFFSGEDFLAVAEDLLIGCALINVRMPGMDGFMLQAEMEARGLLHPIVFMASDGQLSEAVQAMRNGAIDFLEKPFDMATLLAAIERGLVQVRLRREGLANLRKLALLTKREREILNGLARGKQSKIIAYELDISSRTVEMHRANIMIKLGEKSMTRILLMAHDAGVLGDT